MLGDMLERVYMQVVTCSDMSDMILHMHPYMKKF